MKPNLSTRIIMNGIVSLLVLALIGPPIFWWWNNYQPDWVLLISVGAFIVFYAG